ncbi:Cytosol aminopeptidase [Nocardioides dokdonensis FR1436]|uniref:Probable cytosol aminopeptidase n=1 Tax=Nocardioides dokdonensis FR1436 TaxID=1300347 RepID=A0A1A9GKJ3_9ACTN|nr:leucyl aminopeptidase family protein [Nocardioides dokdonensis]ANH38606.1 Cytosol aminopeptidase [Nocardioides dokdonensis FR1436]
MPAPTADHLPPQVAPPEVALSDLGPYAVLGVDVVAVPVLPAESPQDGAGDSNRAGSDEPRTGPVLGPGAAELSDGLGLDLLAVLDLEEATGAVGEVIRVPVPLGGPENAQLRWVLLVGVGQQRPVDLRRAGAALARAVRNREAVATSVPAAAGPAGMTAGLEAFVVGLVLGSFGFSWSSRDPEQPPVRRAVLAGVGDTAEHRQVLARALAIAGAGWQARLLATVPSNLKNPAWLAQQAVETAGRAGLDVEIWDEHRLADEGFGGVLGVGQASASPPRLIRLDYTPPGASKKTPTVVLVGKGITFDTGGLSIKPAEGMATMKRDMTGGAVVIATMAALGAVGCPVRVVGLVPAAENAVSGSAMRPGDVVRHYGGRTSEVTNTDAEGRLVMADALAYGVARLQPAAIVDVATLTGAMKVALGLRTGGYFADDEALAAHLAAAAEDSGETLWRMPLADVYEERIASEVADADNAGGGPGAITAALFLRHFTGDVPWAHLDIASVGDSPVDVHEYSTGPTGFGARALLSWLGSADPLAGVGEGQQRP